MKNPRKIIFAMLNVFALVGFIAGLVFVFQLAQARFQPSNKTVAQPRVAAIMPTPSLNPEPASTATPTMLENGWILYLDPDGLFTFAYPATAHINAGRNPLNLAKNITLQFETADKSYQGMTIRIELNPKRLQGSEFAVQLLEKSSQKSATTDFAQSLQPLTVDGLPAIQAHIPSTNTEVTIIIPYDDKVFIVSPEHGMAVTTVEKETLEIFYQILNSFKFGTPK